MILEVPGHAAWSMPIVIAELYRVLPKKNPFWGQSTQLLDYAWDTTACSAPIRACEGGAGKLGAAGAGLVGLFDSAATRGLIMPIATRRAA